MTTLVLTTLGGKPYDMATTQRGSSSNYYTAECAYIKYPGPGGDQCPEMESLSPAA